MDGHGLLPSFPLSVRREDAEGRYVNAILTTRMKGGLAQKAVGPSFRPKGKGKESREHKGGNGKVQEVIQGSAAAPVVRLEAAS